MAIFLRYPIKMPMEWSLPTLYCLCLILNDNNSFPIHITNATIYMQIMKRIIAALVLLCQMTTYAQSPGPGETPVDWVNPLMGTDSKGSLSNGNTYPAIGLPWGMNIWTPQTGKMGDGWQYTYAADKIRGFKQTHQPSPWMNDYGQFSLMPVTGKAIFDENERASWFSHKAEIAKPHYYKVHLADYDVTTEIAPTERAAMFRFTFPKSKNSYIITDAFD